jgi:hypothetical protein
LPQSGIARSLRTVRPKKLHAEKWARAILFGDAKRFLCAKKGDYIMGKISFGIVVSAFAALAILSAQTGSTTGGSGQSGSTSGTNQAAPSGQTGKPSNAAPNNGSTVPRTNPNTGLQPSLSPGLPSPIGASPSPSTPIINSSPGVSATPAPTQTPVGATSNASVTPMPSISASPR